MTAEERTWRIGEVVPAALHAVVQGTVRRWHPGLRRLLALASIPDTSLITVRTAVPVAPWPASRVTLIGDAIHSMSPSRGSGASTALRDAALLTTELSAAAAGRKTVAVAIADYERQMTSYGFAAVQASRPAGLTTSPRRGAWSARRGRWRGGRRAGGGGRRIGAAGPGVEPRP
jgi:2-polyprenyl-6-methoxyphenol hydroxylase-like FAD-dependent oxidoreductase